jgi:Spy/CpxP family protein refolding chaperone
MKTLVLMLCLALVGATATTAQAQGRSEGKPSVEEMAAKKTAKLTEALALTEAQQNQVNAIVLEKLTQKEELKNTRLTEDERREAMKEVNASYDAKLKAVFTPEQLAKYEANKNEMKQNKHGHHKGAGHSHKGDCPHSKGDCPHSKGSK